MAILNIQTVQTGLVGVLPSLAYIYTSDTEATALTTGYLNKEVQNGVSFSMPCMAAVSTQATPTSAAQVGWYQVAHVGSNWSLVPIGSPGDVVLPTIANYLAHFTNTTGTLSSAAANVINLGNIQAGISGTAGTLISFPSTLANGSLILAAVNAGGAFNSTISNTTMGQSTVFTMPNPVSATARFLVGATATPFVSGNFPVASGTGGLMIDSGASPGSFANLTAANTFSGAGQIILAKANGTEAANAVTASGNAGVITTSALTTAAGSSYAITWTNTKISTTSVIGILIQGGTNTVNSVQFKCIVGSGTATLTIYNIGPTDALNGTILLGYTVL